MNASTASYRIAAASHRARGFTLLEVMVVIVILGIMAAMIAPNVLNRRVPAQQQKVRTDLAALSSALDMYQLDNFSYPTTDQGLQALISSPSPDLTAYPEGGYLRKNNIKDPWGRDYIYLSPGQQGGEYDIFSYGRDGAPGGEGADLDIGSWE
ncbi:MAG: type II secretion system major pseudopilin GspG [Pseudomonadota bacterium]